MNDPIDNIKPFLAVAGALIALGMGWAELNNRIDRKAEIEDVREVQVFMHRIDERLKRIEETQQRLICRQYPTDTSCE